MIKSIVKVQSSLHTTEAVLKMLVYNEDKSIHYEADLTAEVRNLLAGRPKAYFEFALNECSEIRLGKEVAPQNW
ncbi:hypothetical protein KsCSTR_20120 [Candidatus Kuenenia stuttgartiensis]|uniref:Uncharacterized protein n=1 Tax=Kuenenia stuttgartiensis TaxID=174633 RepID=Q1Q2P9_KUEST|nr:MULTISPECIES: hypothetical protein [Kuenenia]MCZ7622388.1 hypothetical protein [Candidatus Kuenenia sp.]QII11391.1 hypothetical protein KsCSTR_20120 [Candidatus Kuenenia stuttgartiensis]CAJ74290.1 unknown protein [Candidatus Kuenenia stuttgartiensis]